MSNLCSFHLTPSQVLGAAAPRTPSHRQAGNTMVLCESKCPQETHRDSNGNTYSQEPKVSKSHSDHSVTVPAVGVRLPSPLTGAEVR
jgi:hypothetical protein